MIFSKISYPQNQIYKLDSLIKRLDEIFFDVERSNRRVLIEKTVLNNFKVEPDYLKQVYQVEDNKILRFDQTHVFFQDNFKKEGGSAVSCAFNESKVGPVFRKEPVGPNRWRQFYQYDLDYNYETHGYRPLIVLLRFIKNCKVFVNDTTLIESKSETKEEEIKKRYKDLFEFKNVFYSPTLTRPSYYKGLIFEIYSTTKNKKNFAIAGGGNYFFENRNYFGFGLGLSRLLSIIENESELLDYYMPLKDIVLIFFKDRIPANLLDGLEKNKIEYHLEKYQKPLIKKALKCTKKLYDYRKKRKYTLIVSKKEDDQKRYSFKKTEDLVKQYSLEDLIQILKKEA